LFDRSIIRYRWSSGGIASGMSGKLPAPGYRRHLFSFPLASDN